MTKHLQNESVVVVVGHNGSYVYRKVCTISLCILNIRMGHAAGHLRNMERSRNHM